jgi:hypothetical protein
VATKQTRTTAVNRPVPSTSARTTARSSPLVYVYCIVERDVAPGLGRAKGLPDAGAARAVPVGQSRWLVLADVPRARFDERALEEALSDLDWVGACAVAHDALIMHVMKAGPVVPMRLFTIFEDEERARAQAKAAAKKVTRTLRRVAGHAEYGVRIGTIRRTRLKAAAQPVHAATGRSFLEQKRDQLVARRAVSSVPLAERQRVFERLASAADEARERPIPEIGSTVWLDGAFLVPLRNAPAFRREVQRLAAELKGEGHEVVLTGPWPPYSFLDEYASES